MWFKMNKKIKFHFKDLISAQFLNKIFILIMLKLEQKGFDLLKLYYFELTAILFNSKFHREMIYFQYQLLQLNPINYKNNVTLIIKTLYA